MNVYAVITIINDEKYERFLKNLNIYHGREFPLCKKNQIYKVINRDMCVVRVKEFWTTGDLLGCLSVEIDLSDEDKLYCVPLDYNHHSHDLVRHNHHYLDARLEDVDVLYSSKQAAHIFYLANYLYMLEKDEVERERTKNEKVFSNLYETGDLFFTEINVISDRFQHWTTDKKYLLKVDISSKSSGRGKIVEEHVTFARFHFNEIEEWIQTAATALGFKVYLCRDSKLVSNSKLDEVNRDNFRKTELVFVDWSNDWKEKIDFELDGKTGARFINLKVKGGEWERITRKPYNVVLPNGIWFDDKRYHDMMTDV
jgi:hypothetical protein